MDHVTKALACLLCVALGGGVATAKLPYVYTDWQHFTVKDGLPNDHIFAVEATEAKVWVGTEDGLACIDKETGTIESWKEADGLPWRVVSALDMNPKTGEIMALATTLRIDLNDYWEHMGVFSDGIPFNRGVSEAYEPGSVFKVITMASALDSGAVTPDTVFVDTGMIEIGGTYIYNWNMGGWGPQTMLGCMQHSLNVCLAHVATLMGPGTFYRYLQAFGLGRLTGVDMAGETPGRLKVPGDSDWYAADLGTNAFGQGVSVSPVQIASAISAVANGGAIVTPHIVRSVVTADFQHDIDQAVVSRPISAETAHTLTEMLAQSLEIESSDALVTGYRVAGKTGTAEIPTPFGYTTSETNASFVGWGPVDDPQFLVYIWLEKPTASPWGSVVAAPVFRQAVEKLVVLIDLPPDDIRHQLSAANQSAASLNGE